MSAKLYVIYGPMYAGKTTELLRYKRRADIARKKTALFKPVIDDRYSREDVVTHDGISHKAFLVLDAKDIENILADNNFAFTDIFIDEVQFFGPEIVQLLYGLVLDGINVYAAGLNTDFRGVPFDNVAQLLVRAHHPIRLTAVCSKCGSYDAIMTQRLINGKPAKLSDPIIVVGGQEMYEARCLECHEIGVDGE